MTWSSASGSDRSLRHQESCSSVWRRRRLCWPEWSDPPGLSWVSSHALTHLGNLLKKKHLEGESGGLDVLSLNVKQQHHHLFTGLKSFSRGSGHQRNVSVWKVVNHWSRHSKPSSTNPVRAAWRVSSWGCLTGRTALKPSTKSHSLKLKHPPWCLSFPLTSLQRQAECAG